MFKGKRSGSRALHTRRIVVEADPFHVAKIMGNARVPFIFVRQAGKNTIGDVPIDFVEDAGKVLDEHGVSGRYARAPEGESVIY